MFTFLSSTLLIDFPLFTLKSFPAMNSSTSDIDDCTGKRSFWIGIVFAAVAAVGYTAANGFLRGLSGDVDATFVAAIKACWTSILFGPAVIFMTLKGGLKIWPSMRWILGLLGVGVCVQLLGNLPIQWSFYYLGIALTVPIILSTMIVWSTIIGWWVLGERVPLQVMFALFLLIVGTFVLANSAQRQTKSTPAASMPITVEQFSVNTHPGAVPTTAPRDSRTTDSVWPAQDSYAGAIIGIAAAMVAGLAFAALGIALRKSAKVGIPKLIPMILVSISGISILGCLTLGQNGGGIILQTTWPQWQFLCMAGICNSIAFLSLSFAFKALPVVYVNGVNACQAIMAALVGFVFFQEQPTIYLLIGIILSVTGFLLMTKPRIEKMSPR